MAHLHSLGILHRSLAPKNVLLDGNLSARIRDYGLATLKDDIWTAQRASNPRFPLYDSQYIAPELLRGAPYTVQVGYWSTICRKLNMQQVDVFSFGVLLWEAFARENAIDGLVLRDLPGCPYPFNRS